MSVGAVVGDAADHDLSSMALRVVISWAGVIAANLGIERWSDFAALLASIYTVIMIGEWIYKRWLGMHMPWGRDK